MRYADRTLTTVSELVAGLREFATPGHPVWYRGQADAGWKLVPAIGRVLEHLKAELTLIKLFKQNARPHLREYPNTEWEWVFLMQHHRAPTRLLDWSESPLVGLYFALWDQQGTSEKSDAALWFLDPI